MPSDNTPRWKATYLGAYAAILVFIAIRIADYHHPVYGYSWLPLFGDQFSSHELPRLLKADRYVYPNSFGYDGQFYAQMALYPSGIHEDLSTTPIYNHYRTRRYLLSWTAWVAGGGEPSAVIQAYSFQNAVFWLGIALLLLRWLPPNSFQNFTRYAACLFTLGLVESWDRALLDGPALFLIALGIYLLETRRPWLSTVVLGVSGLAKETNILAVATLPRPDLRDRREIFAYIGKASAVVAPIALWLVFLYTTVPVAATESSLAGSRNFDWPLVAWFTAVTESIAQLKGDIRPLALLTSKFSLLIALLIQFVCLIAFRDRSNAWWKIGIAFTGLGVVLGGAVWEGAHSAAAFRVLLPVTIAFNILLPKSAKLVPILIIANLPSIAGIASFDPNPPGNPSQFFQGIEKNHVEDIEFNGWTNVEIGNDRTIRRANGPAEVRLVNTSDASIFATIGYSVRAIEPSVISISHGNQLIQEVPVRGGERVRKSVRVELSPGRNTFIFGAEQPVPRALVNGDFSFSLLDFRLLEQLEARKLSADDIPPSVEHVFKAGWHLAESDDNHRWHWSAQPTATIAITNGEGLKFPVHVNFEIRAVSSGSVAFAFNNSEVASLDLQDTEWHSVSLPLYVPPGSHTLSLTTGIDGYSPPGDERLLFVCIQNLDIIQLVPTSATEPEE